MLFFCFVLGFFNDRWSDVYLCHWEFPLRTIHGFQLSPSEVTRFHWTDFILPLSMDVFWELPCPIVHVSSCWCLTVVSCCFVVSVNSVQQSCDPSWLNKKIFSSSHCAASQHGQTTKAHFIYRETHRGEKCWWSDLASACVSISVYCLTRRLLSFSSGVTEQMTSKKRFAGMWSAKLFIDAFLALTGKHQQLKQSYCGSIHICVCLWIPINFELQSTRFPVVCLCWVWGQTCALTTAVR